MLEIEGSKTSYSEEVGEKGERDEKRRKRNRRRREETKLINQEDRPIPVPKEGEAQIAMSVTGLCGSDREYLCS